jgi:opacity protein-like surface antigen
MYAPVIHGPNPWVTGGLFGPRYNFIQEGWPVIPYLESRVGFMFTNATGAPDSQGQDFCFSFTVAAGVRIPVMDRLSVNFGVLYQHISNGGLSEPETENVGLDSIGPTMSVSWAF